ncbi:cytochrome c oxidase subunit II [Chthonobacter rhizosphaerae]|uniref:cytochrome c oxidase subunit II n=1 Tax=Chthonobacter rhizosphaerae TaxID=2735553 RepID=UPI0015EE7FEB|nr:cytochrome c oxidase subunit II [Chthonobacter rhizosphaerae]
MKRLLALATTFGALGHGAAQAAQPVDWGLYLQPAASPVMADVHSFGSFTFWIIVPVTLLVLALLVIVIVKFNAKANPVPSRTSHNTLIEVIWTVAPVLILLMLAVPSFRLLYEQQTIPNADVTVKITGNKWYWSYEYPDAEAVSFDSTLIEEDQITDPVKQPRLLAVDYPMVVPVGKVVRIQVTAADVLHSFAMPAMGVKIDAIPGRLNEAWFRADQPGVYYGQCSELCGLRHAYMPIQLNVVSDEQYAQWLAAAAEDMDAATQLLASFETDTTKVAAR